MSHAQFLLGVLCAAFLSACVTDVPDTCDPQPEVCNGADDDCDDIIDEDEGGGPLRRDCSNACGFGQEECEMGRWRYCDAPQPTSELCDGSDNDCDGEVDEGCECRHGERRSCGIDVGVCEPGVEHCESGEWMECQLPYNPDDLVEICNDGLDNDCDGDTDEACLCTPGDTQPCGLDEGECEPGVMTCGDDSTWTERCEGAVGPTLDVCDGLDNDCDGEIDYSLSADFGWAADEQEPNDTCADAAQLYADGGLAELREGSDWVGVVVEDETDIRTYPTLFRGEDEDWYAFRAIEASDWCVPFSSECSYVVRAQLWLMDDELVEGVAQEHEDWRICIATASCAEMTDASAMTCTHASDYDARSHSYLFSVSWAGSCGSDDSRDVKVKVYSPTGAACGHYQLYVRFDYDDTIACP